MPDWRAEIRRRLVHARLSPAREAEVVEELAQHVQDRYDELIAAGEDDATARAAALDECDGDTAWPTDADLPAMPIGLPGKGATMRSMLWQGVRYTPRTGRKGPPSSGVVVLTPAGALGAPP